MRDANSRTSDVAIVGAGIVGCSIAYFLARHGLKIAVFERGTIGSEQSSRAWGFIRQQGRHEAEMPLAFEATSLWRELTKKLGRHVTEFTQAGILVPAETDEDEERVAEGYANAKKFDLSTRILSPAQIRELIPELNGRWRSALYTREDAHGEPASSTGAIAQAAIEQGVKILEFEPVHRLELSGGKVVGVSTSKGLWRADIIILAAGIDTPRLARDCKINLPIQTIKGSVAQTRPVRKFTDVALWGPDVSFRPRVDGSFYIGVGYRGAGADYDMTLDSFRNLKFFLPAYRRNWHLLRLTLGREFISNLKANFDAGKPLPEPLPNAWKVKHNLEKFRELFPHLDEIALLRSWAGRIDLTPDVIPIIDRPLAEQSFFIVCGLSGHGFALAPSIGKQMAEWIALGRPSLDLKPFRASRFSEGDIRRNEKAL